MYMKDEDKIYENDNITIYLTKNNNIDKEVDDEEEHKEAEEVLNAFYEDKKIQEIKS